MRSEAIEAAKPGLGRSAVVIGGGMAGLTAAWDLTRAGWRVTLVEAADGPGGRCREIMREGLRIRTGARLLYSFYDVVMSLIGELGLEDQIVRLGHSTMIGRDRNFTPYPLSFGWHPSLLTGRHLPLRSKLGLSRLLFPLMQARLSGNPDDMASLAWADGESLSDFLHARGGAPFVDAVVAPLFRGARSWNPQEVSPAFFLLTTAFQPGHFAFTLKDGIGTLAARLADRLDVRYRTSVKRIASDDRGVSVVADDADGEFSLRADIAICAVEGDKAGDLIRDPLADQRRFLSQVRYNPLAILYGLLPRTAGHRIEFLQPGNEAPLALVETVPGGDTPGGRPHLFCELSPEASRSITSEADMPAQIPQLRPFIARHHGDALNEIQTWVTQFIPSMLPLPYPGYATAMADFRTSQQRAPRRVYLCGDYLATPLVGGACASGRSIAALANGHWPASSVDGIPG